MEGRAINRKVMQKLRQIEKTQETILNDLKDIKQGLGKLEIKSTKDRIFNTALVLISLAVACWGIGFIKIENIDLGWLLAGWFLYFCGFAFILWATFYRRKQ